MARPLRIEFSGDLYHVTSRWNASDLQRSFSPRMPLPLQSAIGWSTPWLIAFCIICRNAWRPVLASPPMSYSEAPRLRGGASWSLVILSRYMPLEPAYKAGFARHETGQNLR